MNEICIGNIVQVKESYLDEISGQDFRGWKGRVRLIYDPTPEDPEPTLLVEWTAETIRQMPDAFIQDSYESEAAWTIYYLPASRVTTLAEPHPEIEAEWQKEAVCERIFWPLLGREGRIITDVFKNISRSTNEFPLHYWHNFLQSHLVFPIKGIYDDPEEDGDEENPLKSGDQVRVTGLSGWGYPLGILCECESVKDSRSYVVPLQDIEGQSAAVSKNDRYLEAYRIWLVCRN